MPIDAPSGSMADDKSRSVADDNSACTEACIALFDATGEQRFLEAMGGTLTTTSNRDTSSRDPSAIKAREVVARIFDPEGNEIDEDDAKLAEQGCKAIWRSLPANVYWKSLYALSVGIRRARTDRYITPIPQYYHRALIVMFCNIAAKISVNGKWPKNRTPDVLFLESYYQVQQLLGPVPEDFQLATETRNAVESLQPLISMKELMAPALTNMDDLIKSVTQSAGTLPGLNIQQAASILATITEGTKNIVAAGGVVKELSDTIMGHSRSSAEALKGNVEALTAFLDNAIEAAIRRGSGKEDQQ